MKKTAGIKGLKPVFLLPLFLVCIGLISCNKFLDKKPQQSLVVPSSLSDLQALLDYINKINQTSTPALNQIAGDDYYVATSNWQSLSLNERLNYVWDKDAVEPNSWNLTYEGPVYYSNFVLDVLPKVDNTDSVEWNTIKGTALFYRSFAFNELAQVYCRPYSTTSDGDLGIVLKLSSDINEKQTRSTVRQTYDQITGDLKKAADLLPASNAFPTRPNKAAAYGALARVYLSMRDYVNAGFYSDLSLRQQGDLMDYNTEPTPFTRFNTETQYYSYPYILSISIPSNSLVDTSLYQLFADGDLRKSIFFKDNGDGTHSFNGSYSGGGGWVPFNGICTDEMYLVRAECYARAGNVSAALDDLNALISKRWLSGAFVPFSVATGEEALHIILEERRKELMFRGLRWSDIRRLNLEGAGIELKRIINGNEYTLPPNDLRSVMLIPAEVVNLSGIQQNPR